MNLELVLFILFAAVAAVSAVAMITRPHPVLSAIFLIVNFFALAGLYLVLNAQFISVVQIIVYAGAIMVLFLFVLMLLNTKSEIKLMLTGGKIKFLAIFLAFVVFMQIAFIVFKANPSRNITPQVEASVKAGTVEQIGRSLFVDYVLPFEAAGFLLLAAAIGALVLAKKKFE